MAFDLITSLVGVMTAIMLAGIPWAYKVGERLSSIEATIKSLQLSEQTDIAELLRVVRDLQAKG